ncbi:hypothetical protein GCM10009304_30740 [Pseudomonas matsuisoli]|uniref:Uncharacterized protein n=1 Tax=Pseudomonas matsuisoli TaxID=1515666 RepID=A0A917PZU7_9PSED|nr:hypothetical protein GCM10009304_30740 [Pseudomonas matsuisoli]
MGGEHGGAGVGKGECGAKEKGFSDAFHDGVLLMKKAARTSATSVTLVAERVELYSAVGLVTLC